MKNPEQKQAAHAVDECGQGCYTPEGSLMFSAYPGPQSNSALDAVWPKFYVHCILKKVLCLGSLRGKS